MITSSTTAKLTTSSSSNNFLFMKDIKHKLMHQGGSTLLLGIAISTFPSNVDIYYKVGCMCNFFISFIYHMCQETYPLHTIPKEKRILTRLPSSNYEWPCSKTPEVEAHGNSNNNNNDKPSKKKKKKNHYYLICHYILKRLDQAIVCYICLYTGVVNHSYYNSNSNSDNNNSSQDDEMQKITLVISTIIVSLLGGFIGMPINGMIIGYAFYLTLFQQQSPVFELSFVLRLLYIFAALTGPLCFIYMIKLGAWCTPYRYYWHLCCSYLVCIGGILNS